MNFSIKCHESLVFAVTEVVSKKRKERKFLFLRMPLKLKFLHTFVVGI